MKKRKRINLKPRRKYSRRKKRNFFLFSFFTLIIITGFAFIAYTFFFFPKILNKNIKNDILAIYDPILYDYDENILIIKLKDEFSSKLQSKTVNNFKEKYGLDAKFYDLSAEDKSIVEIVFYKNRKEFDQALDVYIFWNNKEEEETADAESQKAISKKDIREVKEILKKEEYDKLDEKRKLENREKLLKPKEEQFKPVIKEKLIIKNRVRIAVVIDDLGYSYNSTYDFLTLGFPVTFALIPEQSDSKKFYDLFNKYGYELILHIPMEPEKGRKYVEDNAIYSDMDDKEVRSKIKQFFNEYPNVVGANNHMGSKIISDERLMSAVLGELKDEHKIWLDSKTNTIDATKVAAGLNKMNYFERDVFLDNSKDEREIRKSMDKLVKEAKRKGYAVGIGHVQTKELVAVLKEYFDKSNELGIEFVRLSKLR